MQSSRLIGLCVVAGWALACSEPAPDLTPMMPDPAPREAGTAYLMLGVSGKGTVDSAGPAPKLSCAPSCFGRYPAGTRVLLTATPEPGWVFDGWQGDRDCIDGTVTVEAERRCVAKFSPQWIQRRSLHLLVEGGGAVSFEEFPKTAGCDEECIRSWEEATEVTMKPHPRFGWLFEAWGGDPDCLDGHVTLETGKLCIAVFGVDLSNQELLVIEVSGHGVVRVDAFPPPEPCNRTCMRGFPRDSVVLLSGIADRGRNGFFRGFGGDPDCSSGEVKLDRPKHCIAYFVSDRAMINLIGSPGGVLQIAELGGASCDLMDDDEPCGFPMTPGATMNVVAVPHEGFELSHWLGDCRGEPITVPEHDLTCKAIFRPEGPACPEGADDTAAPFPPSGVRATAQSCTAATVRWGASTDRGQCGVKSYRVYRNGRLLERTTELQTGLQDAIWMHPGAEHRYQVSAVDAAGNESALSDQAVVQLPACPKMPSRIDTAMVMFKFPEFANEPIDVASATRQLFNPSGSLAAYVNEVTYGEATLQGDVYGWYVLPNSIETYCAGYDEEGGFDCNYEMIRSDAARLADPDVDFAAYDRVMFAYNDVTDWGGLAGAMVVTDEGVVQPMVEIAAGVGFNTTVLMHELGHTINVTMHAASWQCSAGPVGTDHTDPLAGGCLVQTYGDFIDPMGGGVSHLSAYHKERMGYLKPSNSQVVQSDGEYELAALELPSDEVQQLKIPLDVGAGPYGDFYSLEYRVPIGVDLLDRRGQRIEGVVVRVALAYPTTASADTLLPTNQWIVTPGQPFYDPFQDITIEMIARGGGQAKVRISGVPR